MEENNMSQKFYPFSQYTMQLAVDGVFISKKETKEEKIEKWKKQIYVEYIDDPDSYIYRPGDGIVICCNAKRGTKIGMARCMPTDTYDFTTGICIAYARYRGYNIPKEIFE